MSHRTPAVLCALLVITTLSAWAAKQHHSPSHAMHHVGQDHGVNIKSEQQLLEGGQASFSALIELVSLLEQDNNTDWDSVDIDKLHAHLLDMNRLVLDTNASSTVIGKNSIQYDVLGSLDSTPSIHRMVAAHSRFISQSRGWHIEHTLKSNGATLTITADNPATLRRLEALGFYGFMSLDSHHQAHHFHIATGGSH